MKSLHALCAAIAGALLGLAPANLQSQDQGGELRTWTSTSGTKIEASLVSAAAGKVTLKTKEGRTITVRSDQLSEADRKWLAEQAPKPKPDAAAGDGDEAGVERLKVILTSALTGDPEDAEREEAEKILATFLPDKGANGEEVDWDIRFSKSGTSVEERESVLVSVDMNAKGTEDRLVWMHIVFQKEKPEVFTDDKIGRYPVVRAENRHAFVLVGRTDVRVVEDHESYESDAKLDALVESLNLEAIAKL